MHASKALAALRGKDFIVPEDIQEVAFPVLRHRIILSPEKEMEGLTNDEVIRQILRKIEVPR
jgi:MoxR-like ATPase